MKHYRAQAKDVYNQVNTVMKYKAESSFVNAVNSVADKWNAEMRRSQQELSNKQDFLDILNSNTADVVNGSAARTKAVRTTIHEMAQKGIPAFVDRSGREWSPEAYVNMDIRATVKNTALEAKFSVMDSLGQDVFEVSSHPGSRPKCRPWQGKLISRSGKTTEITDLHGRKHKVIPLSQTSFGEPDGLFGINCGHRPRGVSDGLFRKSEVEYDDDDAAGRRKVNAQSAAWTPRNQSVDPDKELYNKICRQRELERRVRKSKTEADMLEAAGDTEGARTVRQKMSEQNKALRAYCEDNGLKFRSDRVRTYGSVKPEAPSSLAESIDKPTKSDIIKSYHKADTKSYTRSGSNLFDNSSKKALVNSEKEIAANDFETAIIYSESGERIFDYTNGGETIHFSASELRKIPSGAVITHNHPNGTVPSPEDVAFLLNRDISEIRACNKCGAYVIRKTPGWDKHHLDLEGISKEFFGYSNGLSAEYNERAAKEGKSIFEYLCEIDERSWKSFCDNHGLEFIWEERI